MSPKSSFVLLVGLQLLLASCTSVPTYTPEGQDIELSDQTGAVISSVKVPAGELEPGAFNLKTVTAYFHQYDPETSKLVEDGGQFALINGECVRFGPCDAHLSDYQVVSVPVGHYYLTHATADYAPGFWSALLGGSQASQAVASWTALERDWFFGTYDVAESATTSGKNSLKFEVRGGEVLYIGDLTISFNQNEVTTVRNDAVAREATLQHPNLDGNFVYRGREAS